MSRCAIAIVMTAAIIASTTVYAQSPSPSPPSTPPNAATQVQNEIKIVAQKLCNADPVIGTRIPVKRRCNTPAELAEYQQQAREIIENYMRRPCVAGTEAGERVQQLGC